MNIYLGSLTSQLVSIWGHGSEQLNLGDCSVWLERKICRSRKDAQLIAGTATPVFHFLASSRKTGKQDYVPYCAAHTEIRSAWIIYKVLKTKGTECRTKHLAVQMRSRRSFRAKALIMVISGLSNPISVTDKIARIFDGDLTESGCPRVDMHYFLPSLPGAWRLFKTMQIVFWMFCWYICSARSY